MEFLILFSLILLLIYGYFYTSKLAKKYSRNTKIWLFYYLLIGPFATIILILIDKKHEDSNE